MMTNASCFVEKKCFTTHIKPSYNRRLRRLLQTHKVLFSILFFVFSVALETKSEPASNLHQRDIWTPDGYLDLAILNGMGMTDAPRTFMSRVRADASSTISSMQSAPQPLRFSFSMVTRALKMYRASLSNE
jgi:hypothetical protein